MDSSLILPLFVYGTLLDADMRRLVLGRDLAVAPALAEGMRTVFFPRRLYPALVEKPGGSAPGLLLIGLEEADIAALDLYEEDEYERRPFAVRIAGERREAQYYAPLVNIGPEAPDWSLADWQRNHKASALVVAEAMLGRGAL